MSIKKLILFLIFLFLFIYLPHPIKAQVLFSDDFNDNDANGWIVPRNTCSGTWSVSSNKYGITTNSCITETIPSSLSIGLGVNYSFDVDMTMTSSLSDRNFVFKYKDSNNWYGIHTYQHSLYVQKVVGGTEYFLNNRSQGYDFTVGETYHFTIEVINNTEYRVYVDNVLLATIPDESPYFDNYSAGLQASGNSQVWFDNVVVTEIMDATAAPTATASPTPIIPILSVPSLKQYSEPWQGNLYGHTVATIKQWGCTLTSAVMVLKYHGHDILPDALNTWLKSQSDGYIGNGLINWLAISRYTKNNDSPSSPTLEYKRLSATENNLDNELNNNRPAILKEEGHFVVATGKLFNGVYAINDPGYADRNDLTSYGNSFLAINSYSPTHSDLSYMMFVASSGITLELIDSNGNVIATSFTEDPINDISDPNNKSGEPLSILLFEKPNSANYKLRVKGSTGEYTLESYLYNVNGVVTQNSFSQTLLSDGTDTYDIVYTKENSETATNTVDVLATISGENGVSSTYGTATITWTTDKLSSSRVIYDTVSHDSSGSAPNYGYAFSTATYNESPKVTSHSVTITGLGSGTLYYYRVISEGSPVSISSEHTFRTLSKAGPPIANGTQNNNVQVLGSDIFKKYIIYQDVYYKDQEEEKKDEKKEVLGSKTETVKTIVKHLDKIDIFLISLASFLILIIIGIRLLPEPDKII